MNETNELRAAQVAAMVHRVKVYGETVDTAGEVIYGNPRRYYLNTTPEERRAVYCRPCAVGGWKTLQTQVGSELGRQFAAMCQAQGVSQARMLRRLIVQKVALTRP